MRIDIIRSLTCRHTQRVAARSTSRPLKNKMKPYKKSSCVSVLAMLLVINYLIVCPTYAASGDFDFFYFVLQWPGSYCDTSSGCCYPTTGKPASDFGIHGLWPNYDDGTYPSNCDSDNEFDESKVSDLTSRMEKEWPTLACPSADGTKFWSHEWDKHGTCSESILDEHSYFKTALDLKDQLNILQALSSAGIEPNGQSYSLTSIKTAIEDAIGYEPYIECNTDESGNSQLYQVYLCVDKNASGLIKCPVFPHGVCGSNIEFPSF